MTDHTSAIGPKGGTSVDDGADATKRATAPVQRERATGRGPVLLVHPEYGPVEGLVGFGIFYLLVDRLTPALVSALSGPLPDLAPDTIRLGTAGLCWLVFGLTLLSIALTQLADNPRKFADSAARERFLDDHRPTESGLRLHLVLMVFGGATAVLAWDTAVAVLESMFPIVVAAGGPLPAVLSLGNAAILVAFFLGFAAYARGLDRLVVGGMREFLYRTYSGDWE